MKKRTALGLALSLFSMPALAAEDFSLGFPRAPSRVFTGDDILTLHIGEGIDDEALSSLFLELDGVDITERVELEGSVITFRPENSHAPGRHTLRIVKLGTTAKIEEIKRWTFLVSGEDGIVPDRAVTLEGVVNGTYTARPWDNYDDETDEPDLQNITSEAEVSVNAGGDKWAASFDANGLANSDRGLNPGGDAKEVGEYLADTSLSHGEADLRVRLGNHDPGAENILMDQFHRRGVSAFVNNKDDAFKAGGFIMNPAAQIGNDNISGVEEEDQRIGGVQGTWRPLPALGEKLELESAFYTGEGGQDGAGSASVYSDNPEGHGYQVGVRSALVPGRLNVRAQYAHSAIDEDGRNATFDEESANAYDLSATYFPYSSAETSDGVPRGLELGVRYYRAGTDYKTLMNNGAESDREIIEARGDYYYDNWTLDGDIAWLRDNIDGDALVPIDSSLQGRAQASYTPKTGLPGMPVFSFGGSFSDDRRLDSPANYQGDGLDRLTTSLNGGVVLSFEAVTWTLDHTYTQLDDDAQSVSDYTSHYTDTGLDFRVSEFLTISPGVQSEFLDEAETGESQNWHARLGVESAIIADRLYSTTHLSAQIDKNTDSADGRRYYAESELTWVMRHAELNRPGFALSLAGHYDNHADTDPFDDEEPEEARVFVRLKFSDRFSR